MLAIWLSLLTRDHCEVHALRQDCQDHPQIIISDQISQIMGADGLISSVTLLRVITGNLTQQRVKILRVKGVA
jgi:hypothetical protein